MLSAFSALTLLVADLHMAQLMPLPLTVSFFSKIQIGFTFCVASILFTDILLQFLSHLVYSVDSTWYFKALVMCMVYNSFTVKILLESKNLISCVEPDLK